MSGEVKRCTKCGVEKRYTLFSKSKGTVDGLFSWCKLCNQKSTEEYHKTKNGLVTKIYSRQKDSSRSRGQKQPSYTLDELRDFIFSTNNFHILYDNWKNSGYKKDLIPSIDRIEENQGYIISNLELVTWVENRERFYSKIRKGDITSIAKPQRGVIQLTKKGVFVAEYISQAEASRATGIKQGRISRVCLGYYGRKTTGGFKWEFSEKEEI